MAAGLEDVVETLVRADSGVAASLGSGDAMRLFPVEIPQTATGTSMAWMIVGEPVRMRAGGGYAGITRSRVSFTIKGATQLAVATVDRALLALLGDYRGTVVCAGGSVVVLDCDRVMQRDLDRSDLGTQGSRAFRRVVDYQFQWTEP